MAWNQIFWATGLNCQHRDKLDYSEQIVQHVILSNTCTNVALFYFQKRRIFTSETVLKFKVGSVASRAYLKHIFIYLTLLVQRLNSIETYSNTCCDVGAEFGDGFHEPLFDLHIRVQIPTWKRRHQTSSGLNLLCVL